MNVSRATNGPPLIEWGVALQSFAGQAESGDQYLVEPFPNGVLVAVVDGLGHNNRAAAVAKTAVAALEGHAHEPIIPLLKRCHEELVGTRGVVMSLASFNARDGTMTWLGVGNVRGLLLRVNVEVGPACESPVLSKACPEPCRERDERRSRKAKGLLLRGGVVGYRLPSLRPAVIPIMRGDTLIFATDGIRTGFAEELILGNPPQQMADRILARHGRRTDDALVLVARYVGGLPQALSEPLGFARDEPRRRDRRRVRHAPTPCTS